MSHPVFDIEGGEEALDLDFGGTTIHAPDQAFTLKRTRNVGIRNATILGGSGTPEIAYAMYRVTRKANRKARRANVRRARRASVVRALFRRRLGVLGVIAVIAVTARLARK